MNVALQKLRTEVISVVVSSATPIQVGFARGAVVQDVGGREYIDFGGGNVVRVLLSFVINGEQLEKGLKILEEGLAGITA